MDYGITTSDGARAAAPTAGYGLRVFEREGRTVRAAVLARGGEATLTGELRRDVLGRFDLAYGFAEREALPRLLEAGYRKLGETRRFTLALRPSAFARTKLGAAGAVVGAGLDALRAASLAAHARRAARDYRLEWPTHVDVDARFDRLWETARRDFALLGVRNAAFVRRAFLGASDGGLALAAIVHKRTDAVAGYAAIARDGAEAHLRDVFAARDALAPLLRLVTAQLAREGCRTVSVRLCGAPALVTSLTLLGFREQEDGRPVIIGLGPAHEPRGELTDADGWYLTEADADG